MDECFFCGTTENLQTHHLTYGEMEETITVCVNCHRKKHPQHGVGRGIGHSILRKDIPRVQVFFSEIRQDPFIRAYILANKTLVSAETVRRWRKKFGLTYAELRGLTVRERDAKILGVLYELLEGSTNIRLDKAEEGREKGGSDRVSLLKQLAKRPRCPVCGAIAHIRSTDGAIVCPTRGHITTPDGKMTSYQIKKKKTLIKNYGDENKLLVAPPLNCPVCGASVHVRVSDGAIKCNAGSHIIYPDDRVCLQGVETTLQELREKGVDLYIDREKGVI